MYKVIHEFRDKYTGEIYKPGTDFTSDEAERINDLLERKLIEGVPKNMPSAFIADKNALQLMTKKGLEGLLVQKVISYDKKQTKAELIDLLMGGEAK